jgi:small subunit ribosomal protein S1
MVDNDETIGQGSESMDEGSTEPESHPMDAFLDGEAYELETPRRGEIRTGTIARISGSDVLVDIGAKSEGLIPTREIEALSEEERADLKVGKEITVYVIRSGTGGDVTTLLSLVRAEEEKDWQDVEGLLESQEAFEGEVSGYNKGGLIVKLGRLRGFVPASQVSLSRRRRAEGDTPDRRWGKMVGEPIVAKVIEVDRRRNRLIISERAAAREARKALKDRLIAELQPGEIRTGHVISLADFGAFVDIGGADGLVHLSEMSWKRISHPRDMLEVGQEVKVKVLNVDPERKRISLSLRELESDPWDEIVERVKEGQLIEGKITKLTKFGAFARLSDVEEFDIEGLIHISELADRRIEHPREVVEEGQVLTLRVTKVERDRRRIGLSLKKVDSAEYAEMDWQSAMGESAAPSAPPQEVERAGEPEFEDFDAALEAEQVESLTETSEAEGQLDEPAEKSDETEPAAEEPTEALEMQVEVDVEVIDESPANEIETALGENERKEESEGGGGDAESA